MDLSALDNKYLVGLVSAIGGVFLTLLTQQILNRRGLFTYFVRHSCVGVSADDAVFGSVRVTWNGNPISNLYSSTAELTNQSIKDYENVVVRAYTTDTSLLTERTDIVGTTYIAKWTDEYATLLHIPPGEEASDVQLDTFWHQRDYLVPIINRGQVVRFHFLNAAKTQNQPSIWLDVLHKGIKLEFCVPQTEVLGVPQSMASLIGVIIGIVLVVVITTSVQTVWIAALLSLVYGFLAQLPGAYAVRMWRRLRDWFRG